MLNNPNPGHAPGMSAVTRRSLLQASPALLAPALLSSPALAGADTPILRLFRQWDELEALACGVSDDECDRLQDEVAELARRIEAEPATCLADLAAKVVASSCYGDFAIEACVIRECEAILAGGAA